MKFRKFSVTCFSFLSTSQVIASEIRGSMRNFTKFLLHSFRRSWPTRLRIGFMLFAGSFMIYMLRANFSIILLAMTQDYHWSSYEQNLLLSAYFCGYVGPNLIAGLIAERFGGRVVIFLIFLVSSVITALVPYLTSENFTYLFLSRLALGVCGVRIHFQLCENFKANFFRVFSSAHATT